MFYWERLKWLHRDEVSLIFIQQLSLSTYYVPEHVTDARTTKVNKTPKQAIIIQCARFM